MVIVPQYNRQYVEQGAAPVRVTAPSGNPLSEMSKGVNAAADALFDVQDDFDTAAAKSADAAFTEKLNDLLYNDQTGYMFAKGGDAIGRREGISQQIDNLFEDSFQGMTGGARQKAETAMKARKESTRTAINRHAVSERNDYLTASSNARIQAAVNTAILDPSQIDAQLRLAYREVDETATREGWPPEVTAAEKDMKRDAAYSGSIMRIANVDAEAAMEALAANRDKMSAQSVVTLEGTLAPLAKEAKGRRLGAAAASGGVIAYDHGTTIDYAMGPRRPNAPDRPVLDVVGYSAERVFGAGARIVVTSGQEGGNPQHGSPRHKTGNAADIAIYRPDGSRVTVGDEDMQEFFREAARNGATGFGGGDGYMGGDTVHIDLVGKSKGGGTAWAGLGDAMEGELENLIAQRQAAIQSTEAGYDAILAIKDPDIRASALREFELRRKAGAAQKKAAQDAASQATYEWVEGGGRIDDLPVETRVALAGDTMTAARLYEAKVVSGETIETDSATYVQLSQLMADDPAAFMKQDPMLWRPHLSDADFKRFADMQRGMKMEGPATAPSVSSMLSEADARLREAGITKTKKPERYAKFQEALTRWAVDNPDLAKDLGERNRKINSLLAEVVADPSWLPFNQKTKPAFEANDIGVDGIMDSARRGKLSVGGFDLTALQVEEAANLFIDENKREPEAWELMDILNRFYSE